MDYNKNIKKSCPLCGHEVIIETYKVRKGYEATIHCDDCLLSLTSITFDTEEDAANYVLEKWNKTRPIT